MDNRPTREVTLRADEQDLRIEASGQTLARLRPGETVTLRVRNNEVYLKRDEGSLFALNVRFEADRAAHWSIRTEGGRWRSYSGTLAVRPDPDQPSTLQLVNAVPLEDYVASVVASEYHLQDTEGTKALAVAVRTYALRTTEKFGTTDYDHVDHTASQMYGGLSAITSRSRAATEATTGEVLVHDGRLIEAVYYASSGGHTANNEDVWDATEVLPYLRGKRDPYERSPHARWTVSVPRRTLLSKLSANQGVEVTGITLGDRSRDGRVTYVNLITKDGRKRRMQANAFRLFVNQNLSAKSLKSTLFDARRRGNNYVFSGRGFGHGVGLSQWGAHEMAKQGHSYRDILGFYYTDVAIEHIDSNQLVPLDAAPPIAQQPPPKKEGPPQKARDRRIGW